MLTGSLDNFNKNKEEHEIIEVMAKLLNVPREEIIKSKKLFSKINPDVKTCFYKLSKLKENDYVTAFMMLEYLLFSGKEKILEVIK